MDDDLESGNSAGNSDGEIIIEEERLREDYTKVPNTVLRRSDISPGAKLAFVMLLSYAHKEERCFPGQRRLAQDIGSGVRSVVRYMQELVAAGLLRVKRRGLGKTNVYYLAQWSKPKEPVDQASGRAGEAAPFREGSAKFALQQMPNQQTEKNKSDKNKIPNGVQDNSLEKGRGAGTWTPIADVLSASRPTQVQRERDTWLADQVIAVTGDEYSRDCYLKLARRCPQELILEALALLRDASRRSAVRAKPGALFLGIVRRLCDERRLPDPLRPYGGSGEATMTGSARRGDGP